MSEKKHIKGDLTLEELRTFEGFENVSDEEGLAILHTVITFSDIVYAIYAKQQQSNEGKNDINYNTIVNNDIDDKNSEDYNIAA